MADTNDEEIHSPQRQQRQQFHQMQAQFHQVMGELQHSRNFVANNIPPPQHIPPAHNRPNLNLPQPPLFSGNPLEISTLKIKLGQFLRGNYTTFLDTDSQLMYAGSLLNGLAYQWYETLVDPVTLQLPPSYDLEVFLQALMDFFGSGVTLASRERAFGVLHQSGTV